MQDNPFSTRHIKPGAIPYLCPPGHDLTALLDRLRRSGWWGQLVGPHGSGKSTLLAALLPMLQQVQRRPLYLALHDGQRRLPVNPARVAGLDPSTIVIVDGYEQLNHWNRWRLKRLCRRRGWGLIVSSHADTGLPDLFRTTVDVERVGVIVRQLLGTEQDLIGNEEIARTLARHRGDVREMLLELYDLYEERRKEVESS
jgi:energy-coupling factor transporter ATP-binding protein EcfA2